MKRVYPDRPVTGVGSVVFRNNSVLLIRRGNPPLKDTWSLPGGAVRQGEELGQAVKREIREECGIEIELHDLITLFEYIEHDEKGCVRYHYIVFDFAAEYLSGRLEHSSDAHDARWVPINRLNEYPLTTAVYAAVTDALKHR
jgi:8-oxo-dGTP diphosphatase